jgi:opacity protein-like surface antigen
MQKFTKHSLGFASIVGLVGMINPLLVAHAEGISISQAQEAPIKKPSTPQSLKGWYMTVGAGATWENTVKDQRQSTAYSPYYGDLRQDRTGQINHGSGVAVEGGVGYSFGNQLRAELTYLFNTTALGNQVYSGTITGPGIPGGSDSFSGNADITGRTYRNSVLASLYYDIPTKSRWVPYVGAGLGWTNVSVSSMTYNYDVTILSNGARQTGSDTISGGNGNALGYQAKIGVSYIVSKSTDLFVEGNYQGNTSVDIGTGTILGSFNSFGVKGGFRYRFGK